MPVYGLDFGTTTTYLTDASSGKVTIIPLVAKGDTGGAKDGDALLSRVSEGPSGNLIFGARDGIRSLKTALTEHPSNPLAESYILAILKEVIERASAKKIDLTQPDSVRLGCPAAWGRTPRERLLALAQKAKLGLVKEGLIEEPVAAGLAWIDDNKELASKSGLTFVFDMGGGTLDVAVLDVQPDPKGAENQIWVLGSGGNQAAGDMVDRELYMSVTDKTKNGEAITEYLLGQMEEAKILLSGPTLPDSVKARLSSSSNDTVEITRKQLQESLNKVTEMANETIEIALREAYLLDLVRHSSVGRNAQEPGTNGTFYAPQFMGNLINEVKNLKIEQLTGSVTNLVLVGGMTNVPEVRNYLKKLFKNAALYPEAASVGHVSERLVALGLANPRQFETLNLSRPNIDIKVGNKTHFNAFDSVFKTGFVRDSSTVLRKRACLSSEGIVTVKYFGDPSTTPILDLEGNKIDMKHSLHCKSAPLFDCRDCGERHPSCDCRLVMYPDGTLLASDSSGSEPHATLQSYYGPKFRIRAASRQKDNSEHEVVLEKRDAKGTKDNTRLPAPLCDKDSEPRDIQTHLEFRTDLANVWGSVEYLKNYVAVLNDLCASQPAEVADVKVAKLLQSFQHNSPGHTSCDDKWFAFWIANMVILEWKAYSPHITKQTESLTLRPGFGDWASPWYNATRFAEKNIYQ